MGILRGRAPFAFAAGTYRKRKVYPCRPYIGTLLLQMNDSGHQLSRVLDESHLDLVSYLEIG